MSFDYDYIIAGGGCAGLSLAYYMVHSSLKSQRILLLDREWKAQNDKTWCFWATSEQLPPFTSARVSAWQKMEFWGKSGTCHRQDISPLHYVHVRSLDFYQEVQQSLSKAQDVTFLPTSVKEIWNEEVGARVVTDAGTFTCRYAFSSLPVPTQPTARTLTLKQHFLGWFIKTESPTFDAKTVRLMDFRLPQEEQVRFAYLLPFSAHEALVEFTVFSPDLLPTGEYESALRRYVEEVLGLEEKSYELSAQEFGVIPMTNQSFSRYEGKHIVRIGTAGGMTKASTGYTFLRIQADAKATVEALETNGNPHYKLDRKGRFAFYDSLLLYLIQHEGGKVSHIFNQLFSQQDFRKVLRFLDERTNLWEELGILLRLPWGPFLRALFQYYVLRKPVAQPTKSSKTISG